MHDVGMKRRTLKTKDDCSFWSYEKRRKGFSIINYIVKSSLQKWITSHTHEIKYPIEKYYITVKCDDIIRVLKTELRQKVLLRVSVQELHIDMLKKDATGFPWHTMKRDLSVLVILLLS